MVAGRLRNVMRVWRQRQIRSTLQDAADHQSLAFLRPLRRMLIDIPTAWQLGEIATSVQVRARRPSLLH